MSEAHIFWVLGLKEGKPTFWGSKSEGWEIHNQKNTHTLLASDSISDPYFLWPQAELEGIKKFSPRRALREEPSITTKKLAHTFGQLRVFDQHVAILRDVRFAFLGPRGAYFGGSTAEGREIHNSNTLTHFCPQEAYRDTGICGISKAEAFRAKADVFIYKKKCHTIDATNKLCLHSC